jgi:hypothetical protein
MKRIKMANVVTLTEENIHASALMRKLIDHSAGKQYFTVNFLMSNMPANSFGIIGVILSVLSLVPVIDVPVRLLILVILCQIMMGYDRPVLPGRFLAKQFSTRYLNGLERHVIPALDYIEKAVRPRWLVFLNWARRGTAVIVFFLTIVSLLIPIPFSNVPPAIASGLIALAYLENDGLLLLIAIVASIAMLTLTFCIFYKLIG